MTKTMSAVGVVILAVTGALAAQSRPDFSGVWELDVERSRAANASAGSGGGGGGGTMGAAMAPRGGGGAAGPAAVTTIRITQTPAALTIERVAGQVWDKVVHRLDGTESANANGRTTITIKSRWDGARLVSEGTSRTEVPDGTGAFTGTLKETRWLEADGTLVVEAVRVTNPPPGVQVSNAGKPVTTRQYFRKKP